MLLPARTGDDSRMIMVDEYHDQYDEFERFVLGAEQLIA